MKRVIIADDSQTARMLIRRCLEIVGLGDAHFVEVDEAFPVEEEIAPGEWEMTVALLCHH